MQGEGIPASTIIQEIQAKTAWLDVGVPTGCN